MKTQTITKKPELLEMVISDTEPAVVNSIRRIILGEVPAMAIDTVNMYENTSAANDEYIAHRLGLIPLKTDLKTYKLPTECCEGNCTSCSVEFSLDETGPKMVYSSALKPVDPKVRPVSGKIPIVELRAGQRLRFEAKAVLGKGETHVKFQAGNAAYRHTYDIKTKKKPKIQNETAVINKAEAKGEKLNYKRNENEFLFRVETNGQMTAKDVMQEAIEIAKGKVDSMKACMSKKKAGVSEPGQTS